jgi:hypothetical protein
MSKQDALLNAIENEADIDLMLGLWTLAKNAPSRCAEVLLSYKDVARGCTAAIESLRAVKEEIQSIQAGAADVSAMIDQVKAWKAEMKSIDEEVFLNRLNRLCDVAERIETLKKNGSLRTLKALIEDK